MIEIDRRSVMAGIAATAGAGLLPAFDVRSAKAAAPPAGTQNAGWYRYKVGTHEVTVVTDGVQPFQVPGHLRRQQEPRRGQQGFGGCIPVSPPPT